MECLNRLGSNRVEEGTLPSSNTKIESLDSDIGKNQSNEIKTKKNQFSNDNDDERTTEPIVLTRADARHRSSTDKAFEFSTQQTNDGSNWNPQLQLKKDNEPNLFNDSSLRVKSFKNTSDHSDIRESKRSPLLTCFS